MKILITGICGFIGSNLSRALINQGHDVDGIDDLSTGHLEYLPDGVGRFFKTKLAEVQPGYIGEDDRRHYDIIFHLASRKIPRHGGAKSVLLENNLTTLWAVARAVADKARLVFASTSDIYGMNTDFHEDAGSILGPSDVSRWTYAITKLWSEQFLYSVADELDFVILRYFGSYGPFHSGSWTAGPQAVFIDQAIRQQPITLHGDGQQTRCFTHIDDTVAGTLLAAFSEHTKTVFNIGNPDEEITIRDLAEKIWQMVNPDTPCPVRMIPYSKFKYQDVRRRVPDISLARDLLGFEPVVGQDEGLRRMIEWEIEKRESEGN